jgi:sterol desaturase/sphingolipid hydroxylase (fatty acid hydroxylase superfamily)
MKKLGLFLEKTTSSSSNYWTGLVCDPLCAVAFLIVGLSRFNGTWFSMAPAVLFGFFAWGFFEYALHRWVLHGKLGLPKRGHGQHHEAPRKLVSTPAFVIGFLAVVLCSALGLLWDPGMAALMMFGTYCGYNYYAFLHHLQHHEPQRMARISYFRKLMRLHAVHHRNGYVNYGTTTLLWDRLLGTFQADFSITIKS